MQDAAISVRDLKKHFKVPQSKEKGIRHYMRSCIGMEKYSVKKVIDCISFDVKKGECFGILGPNGTGKSTLMMLLAGILYPDQGTIDVKGDVVPLLHLGAGFEKNLTAKDNIYLYGTLMGLSNVQLNQRYRDILKYAELEGFEKLPLKHFSSGMKVRLAFAIAMEVKHDILLLDEVLSVGDVAFKSKSKERILEICNSGSTVIVVSHSIETILDICDRAMFLKDGKIGLMGDPEDVVDAYLDSMAGSLGAGEMVIAQKYRDRRRQEESVRNDTRRIAEIVRFTTLPDVVTRIYGPKAYESLDLYLSQNRLSEVVQLEEVLAQQSIDPSGFGTGWAELIRDLGDEERSRMLACEMRDIAWNHGMLVYGYDEFRAFFSNASGATTAFIPKNYSIAMLFSGSHLIPVLFDDRERVNLDSTSVMKMFNDTGCNSQGTALVVFPYELTHRAGLRSLLDNEAIHFIFQVPVSQIEDNSSYLDFCISLPSPENLVIYEDVPLFVDEARFDLLDSEIKGFGYYNPTQIPKDSTKFYREILTLRNAFAASQKKTKLNPKMYIHEVAKQYDRYFTGDEHGKVIQVKPDVDTIDMRQRCFGATLLFTKSRYDASQCYHFNQMYQMADNWFKQYTNVFSQKEAVARGMAAVKLINFTIELLMNQEKIRDNT